MICENQKSKKIKIVKRSSLAVMLLWLSACAQQPETQEQEVVDLPQIREKENLVVATCYNSADYFIYKGEPKGFQYEMLTELSKYLGVKVEFIIGKSYSENLHYLSQGHCDMIASGLFLPDDDLLAANVDTLYMARQVLIQRKPSGWKTMPAEELNRSLVRNPTELNGKMVYASGWSALMTDMDFVPDRHIRFTKLKGIESESLVGLVADGELDYAVCEWPVARLIANRYNNIDIQTNLGELPVGWLVRPSSVELQQTVSQWLAQFKKTTKYAVLQAKYHNSAAIKNEANSRFFANHTGAISPYDDLFKKYCKEIGWDWRLLASLVCQESRFRPTVRSKKGAYGLMQLMPATMEQFGADTTSSPEKHIAAGVAYIKFLDKIIAPAVSEKDERIKFILASYNIGPGHIFDAQRLAEKYGKNASVWDNNVDSCLLSKADPKYYNDPDVRFGKCRGKETYAFVTQVLERYEHYKNIKKIQ